MNLDLIPAELLEFYEFDEWRNAIAIMSAAYPLEWREITDVLSAFRILRTDLGERGEKGGGKSKLAIRMDRMLRARGWHPRQFATSIMVDDMRIDSPTHEVDSFKAKIAVELEWNNKTEFYDRDLNNFRLLFDLRVADVGIIITRCDELQDVFNNLGKGSSYGTTTTVLSKLRRKLKGGAGGGCPIIAIGMRKSLYIDDVQSPELAARFEPIARTTKARRATASTQGIR